MKIVSCSDADAIRILAQMQEPSCWMEYPRQAELTRNFVGYAFPEISQGLMLTETVWK